MLSAFPRHLRKKCAIKKCDDAIVANCAKRKSHTVRNNRVIRKKCWSVFGLGLLTLIFSSATKMTLGDQHLLRECGNIDVNISAVELVSKNFELILFYLWYLLVQKKWVWNCFSRTILSMANKVKASEQYQLSQKLLHCANNTHVWVIDLVSKKKTFSQSAHNLLRCANFDSKEGIN